MPEPVAIGQSVKQYEQWLRDQLGGDIVESDLVTKHEKMGRSAFAFLRGTFWRWAETVLEACPDLAGSTSVLAVGDVHLENFGTWRDVDGRLVWGVNDFDEAAIMPFTLDLVRLATSMLLAELSEGESFEAHCECLLSAYRKGLDSPRPIVLDRDWAELRVRMAVSEKGRAKFWEKIAKLKPAKAPDAYVEALAKAMPEPGLDLQTFRRSAGLGSLGRPRWVGQSDWKGGTVLREAKAVLPSAWNLSHKPRASKIRVEDCARGRFRAIDPWYSLDGGGGIVVRRLSPNNRKIDADADAEALADVDTLLLEAMGLEIANIHASSGEATAAIRADLKRLPKGWLANEAAAMAEVTQRDLKEWRKTA
jgi:hypothetical protein